MEVMVDVVMLWSVSVVVCGGVGVGGVEVVVVVDHQEGSWFRAEGVKGFGRWSEVREVVVEVWWEAERDILERSEGILTVELWFFLEDDEGWVFFWVGVVE